MPVAWCTFSSDGHQLDSFAGDVLQSFVDVGYLVEAHLASVRLGQSLTWSSRNGQHTIRQLDLNKSID